MTNTRTEAMSKISNPTPTPTNEALFSESLVCVAIYHKIKRYIGFCFIHLIIG